MESLSNNLEIVYFLDALNLFLGTQWLYNFPVVDLLTRQLLDLFPKEWLSTLQTLENDELNDFVVKRTTKSQWSQTLKNFVEKCKYIDRLPTKSITASISLPRNFQIGLSYKKQHEILQLAHLVHTECISKNVKVIVDLGAGLGYICQLLHYLYGYQVLGLDRNEENVCSARRRQIKMYPNSVQSVKYSCCDITSYSAELIESILYNEFQETPSSICLIGLHACGDLGVHASEIFLNIKTARIFILIPCCYHKISMSKSIRKNTSTEKQYFNYFPLSDSFKNAIRSVNFDVGSFLRQPFLRLACQEPVDRWCNMSSEIHNEHSFHVLARAVLQLYTIENGFILKKRTQKGTRKSQCTNFETYVKDTLNRYVLLPKQERKIDDEGVQSNIAMHESNLIKLWKNHCKKLEMIELYTGLQLMLQAPAESLILKDRLCWMNEHGLEAQIVPVMDKRLSPRAYAIVSHKR